MTKKYELLNTSLCAGFQIRALIDIPRHGVKAGDLGGYVNGEHNLSQEGDCWVERTSFMYKEARVEANALVRDWSSIRDCALVSGNSVVNNCVMSNGVKIIDNAVVTECNVYGSSIIGGNTRIRNTAIVDCILKGQTQIYVPGDWRYAIYDIQGEITEKDYLLQGPALSSGRSSLGIKTANGVQISTGCFQGTLDEYLAAIEKTHKDNPEYLQQYREFHANFVKHFSQ